VDSHIPVLCGAGVKNGKDLRKAMELGAKGVLLASGVIKAKDIKATLIELVTGV
jgi:triosephosphate isomerase